MSQIKELISSDASPMKESARSDSNSFLNETQESTSSDQGFSPSKYPVDNESDEPLSEHGAELDISLSSLGLDFV